MDILLPPYEIEDKGKNEHQEKYIGEIAAGENHGQNGEYNHPLAPFQKTLIIIEVTKRPNRIIPIGAPSIVYSLSFLKISCIKSMSISMAIKYYPSL